MDKVIVKGDSNKMYSNNSTCIYFSVQDTEINIGESDWLIFVSCILSDEPPRSSATLLKSFSAIIIFQERYIIVMHSSDIF